MAAKNTRMPMLAWALGALALSFGASQVLAQGPLIEPEATTLLKRMTDYMGSLDRFSVDTDNMLEDVLLSGQKIQYDFTSTATIQRPNKVRVERTGDLSSQLFVYDGASLTMFNPEDNYYATSPAPDNIDDLLHFARDTLDIVPPTGDLVFTNAYDLLTAPLVSGFVVGKSIVGGVKCDHLAFTTAVVDWQVWIADGDQALPYKYVLTTKDDPAQPQYIVLMSNWDVAPRLDEAMFEFAPPEGAKEVEFLRADAAQIPVR